MTTNAEKKKELFYRIGPIFDQYDGPTQVSVLVAMVSSVCVNTGNPEKDEEYIEWVEKGLRIGIEQLRKNRRNHDKD